MPYIHGSVVHVPGGGKTYGEAGAKAKKGAGRLKRIKRNVQTARSNRTSKPANKAFIVNGRIKSGDKFGTPDPDDKMRRSISRTEGFHRGVIAGAVGGSVPATGVSMHNQKKYEPQVKANTKTIRANNKRIKAATIEVGKRAPKAPRHLLTDVGTKAEKIKRYRPVKPVLAGVATAGGVVGLASAADKSQWTGKIENQKKRIATQEKKLSGIGKSAFGVDHERR